MNPLSALLQLPDKDKELLGALYTPCEIARQAAAWPSTFTIIENRLPEIQSFLESRKVRGPRHERPAVCLIGAGTSDYVGRCLCGLIREHWDCDVEVSPSTSILSSFREHLVPDKPRLWISVSRSGNSPEGVAVLQRALSENPEIAHIVISCDEGGRMTELVLDRSNCLSIVLGEETNDKGLAMTASFTNLVVCGQTLAHVWSPDIYRVILAEMCHAASPFLDKASELAESLSKRRFARGCFLGSGVLAGVASESALKLLELTAGQVKTMSQTTLGLRHGPMAALDRDTLVIQFLSNNETRRRYEIDLLREIESKELVGSLVAVNGAATCALPDLNSTQLLAPDRVGSVPDYYRPALDIMFAQCLGLFSSLELGLTPDTPSSNGAISRVVPAFEIH